jgi:glyoxylase-like metal-dependent hydrolase (beta-lactamase superfamily II)
MGPYDNNGYILADSSTKEAYLVDAPAQIERLLDEAKDLRVKGFLITHTHPDHVAGYADLKRLTDLPVSVHEADVSRLPGKPENLLSDNQELAIGSTRFRVIHTPGHTPAVFASP